MLSMVINQRETFNAESDSIEITYYVISMVDNPDRIANIRTQRQKITADINIFEAINGENVDMDNIPNQTVAEDFKDDSKKRKREVGCFLSHYYVLKKIAKDLNPDGYTVIFEDDFDIIADDFESKLKDTIKSIADYDFDLIFIDAFSNNNEGESVVDGVCRLNKDKPIWGTQAYIVKNANIDRLLKETWVIDMPIDNKYEKAILANKLTAYAFCPYLTRSIETSSTIN